MSARAAAGGGGIVRSTSMPLPSPWRRRRWRRSGRLSLLPSFRALFSPVVITAASSSSSPSYYYYTRLPPPPPPGDGDDDDDGDTTMAAAAAAGPERDITAVSGGEHSRGEAAGTTTPIPTPPLPPDDDGNDDDDEDQVDAAVLAKRVVRKIDRRLMPLLFVTYALNFMDKTIMSSAAVFGLGDDTVGPTPSLLFPFSSPAFFFLFLDTNLFGGKKKYSTSSASNMPGPRPPFILATSPGPTRPTCSSPAFPWAASRATWPSTPSRGAPSSPPRPPAPPLAGSSPAASCSAPPRPPSPRPACS